MAAWPYNTALWKRTRKAQLEENPMCVMCHELGLYISARVVDHIVKVKDDPDLAFDGSNLQSLCKHCHDSHKQAMERGAQVPGSKRDGTPMDPGSHWK